MGCFPPKNKIPLEIMQMPKSDKSPEIQIQYFEKSGGRDQANYIQKLIKANYANAKVYKYPYEHDNLIVKVNGKKIHQKKQDGSVDEKNALIIFKKIQNAIQNPQTH